MTTAANDKNAPGQLQLTEGASENHLTAGLASDGSRSGVQQAEAHKDDWWWSPAWAAVEHLAANGVPFTAYSLTEVCGVPDPDHPARWGALFMAAKKAGVIERAGVTESSRPSRAGGLCRVWRGVPPG